MTKTGLTRQSDAIDVEFHELRPGLLARVGAAVFAAAALAGRGWRRVPNHWRGPLLMWLIATPAMLALIALDHPEALRYPSTYAVAVAFPGIFIIRILSLH